MADLIRILIVDDHFVVRQGLATLLVVVIGFMLPATYTVTRAVTINAAPDRIHTFVGDLGFFLSKDGKTVYAILLGTPEAAGINIERPMRWPFTVLADNPTVENRMHALKTGPYGRCVYHCAGRFGGSR